MNALLSAMNITCEVVYEGYGGDKILMCDMREKGHYCHAILNDETPLIHN